MSKNRFFLQKKDDAPGTPSAARKQPHFRPIFGFFENLILLIKNARLVISYILPSELLLESMI